MTRAEFSCQISHQGPIFLSLSMYFLNQQHLKYRHTSFSPSISHEVGLDYFQRVRSILSHCLPVCQLPIIYFYNSTNLLLISLHKYTLRKKCCKAGGAGSIALDFHCTGTYYLTSWDILCTKQVGTYYQTPKKLEHTSERAGT